MGTAVEPGPDQPEVLARYAEAAAGTRRMIAAVSRQQLSLPTPCTEWDLQALLNHIVVLNRIVVACAVGQEPPPDTIDALGDDPVAAYDASVRALTAVLAAPGALDRTYQMPWGGTGGDTLAWELVIDLVVHAWDIGRATAHPLALGDGLCAAALAKARQLIGPQHRVPGGLGPEVVIPDSAPACDRMAAFYGREP